MAFETPLRLPFVGSRSMGFLPSPAVCLDFDSNLHLEEENLGYTYSKEEKLIGFFRSILSPVVSND